MPDITSDLKGHWTFDDSGATTIDFSGNGNTGTLTGGPPVRVPGQSIGQALLFNGSSDYVNIPANSPIGNLTSGFTIAAWIHLVGLGGAPYAIFDVAESPSASVGFSFQIADTLGALQLTTKGVLAYTSVTGLVSPGVWQHVAVVLDSAFDATFFVQGVQKDTVAHTVGANANTTQAMFIGGSANDTTTPTRFWLSGLVDDLRIYGRALSAADIAALFLYTGVLPKPDMTQFPKYSLRPNPPGRFI